MPQIVDQQQQYTFQGDACYTSIFDQPELILPHTTLVPRLVYSVARLEALAPLDG